MIIVMKPGATFEQVQFVEERLRELGLKPHPIFGQEQTVVGVIGNTKGITSDTLVHLPGVTKIVPIMKPYKLVSRELHPESSTVRVGDVVFGGPEVVVIAGPCAVEKEEQLLACALAVKDAGATVLRGGAFKPRTSPYAFQGLEEEGLKLLAAARQETGLKVVTEVMDTREVELVARYADILQVGARNMQNFRLLHEVGLTGKPVLLKRGLSATIEEWLMAAEYILNAGDSQVVLCERGIRTFESATRNTLDLSSIPVVKANAHLPVVVDPSHATGESALVPSMARAAIAAGADGLIIEVHPEPAKALCDGPQSLNPAGFTDLMASLRAVAEAVGRELPLQP